MAKKLCDILECCKDITNVNEAKGRTLISGINNFYESVLKDIKKALPKRFGSSSIEKTVPGTAILSGSSGTTEADTEFIWSVLLLLLPKQNRLNTAVSFNFRGTNGLKPEPDISFGESEPIDVKKIVKRMKNNTEFQF